jgi:hypothetical protein
LSHNGKIIDISLKDYLNLPKHIQQKLFGYRVPIIFTPSFKSVEDPYYMGFYSTTDIPLQYKYNCPEIQLELLAGIIESIGEFYLPNLIKIQKSHTHTSQQEKDIIFLSRSLGFKLYQTKSNIFIQLQYGKSIPFRKIENIQKQNKLFVREIESKNIQEYEISIERKEIDDYYGFEIDGNRRFVLGDFTVTHNTVMALKIISIIERKTLIIVHKEFLMNQWIERIAEFMPTARIGKIQGPKFDIEDKDIVIGMIQSMYDRPFPNNAFSSFGLTIIDEVHRIGSEEFSKTLFKTITNCMLGI